MACAGGTDIITNGLVLTLDAANKLSYPGSGTTWSNLSGNATRNYGGLKEFVTLDNSFCLRHIEVDATGFWEFPGAKWSRYDEEHMIETMRYCYNNRDKVKEKGIVVSKDACKLSNELFIQTLLKTLSIDF